jgi:uncharacterized protein (UPF0332 family)
MANLNTAGHMKKAISRLKSVEILFVNGLYDEALGAAYYAVFHSISAVLAIDNYEYKSHKAVLANFNRLYVQTGKIGGVSAKTLVALHDKRNESEYRPTVFAGKEGVAEAIKQARNAVDDIIHYFESNKIPYIDIT